MISIILTLIGIGMSGSGVMTILQMKANLSRNWMRKWQKRVRRIPLKTTGLFMEIINM